MNGKLRPTKTNRRPFISKMVRNVRSGDRAAAAAAPAADKLVRSCNQWRHAKTMQAAVFLLELTHFAWPPGGGETHTRIAGTIDKRYGERGVNRLAERKSDKAVENADSDHIALMKLNTMNKIMFLN